MNQISEGTRDLYNLMNSDLGGIAETISMIHNAENQINTIIKEKDDKTENIPAEYLNGDTSPLLAVMPIETAG